jgi:hypothetical protein
VLQQRDRDPPGGPQRLAGLGGGERLGQPGQGPGRLGLGAGRQHDLLGHPQEQARPRRRPDRPPVQAELAQPPGFRRQERRAGQVGQHGAHARHHLRRERRLGPLGLKWPLWLSEV